MITLRLQSHLSGGFAALEQLRARLKDKTGLNASIETGIALTVKRHLTTRYAGRINALGGTSTGYWRRAIEGTTSTSDDRGATVSINQTGVRLKYEGGTIRASGRTSEVTGKPIRFLTIPVHPSAHGKTIADLGGKSAFYIVPFGAGGGLQAGGSGAGGGVFRRTGAKRSDSDPLYYILKQSVRIKADPQILPPNEDILASATEAAAHYFRES